MRERNQNFIEIAVIMTLLPLLCDKNNSAWRILFRTKLIELKRMIEISTWIVEGAMKEPKNDFTKLVDIAKKFQDIAG